MSNEFFKAEQYIEGYNYPSSYIDFVNSGDVKSIKPWWLIGLSEGLFEISFNLLNEDLASNIKLIPFAKSEETNALAFFDEEGKVYFYIGDKSFANENWPARFSLPNFDAWLKKVMSGDI